MNTLAEGGCLCGAMRYRISGTPVESLVCHCVSCRRASGAGAVAWLTVRRADFGFVSGEPARHQSSPGVIRRFCPTCGGALTYENSAHPETIDVTTATLDEPAAYPPTLELWLDHRISWQAVDPTLPHYLRGTADLMTPACGT
jgi:hypothetical protein